MAPIRLELRMVGLAVPLMVSSFATAGLGLVNAIQVAPLGADALTAVGFGAMVLSLVQTIGLGLFAGGRISIAQAIGAADPDRARRIGRALVGLGLGLGVSSLAIMPLSLPIMRALGVPDSALSAATDYLMIRLAGAPLMFVFDAAVHVVQGPGDPAGARRTTRAMIVLGLTAIGASALFVDALELGPAGAAWGANVGMLAGLLVLAPRLRTTLRNVRATTIPRELPAIFALGLPLAAINAADVASHLALQALLAHLGEVDLAAHVLVLRLTGLASLPAYAIGDALSVIIGRAAGAHRHDLVRPFARSALTLALAFVAVVTATFIGAPDALAAVSGATPDVAAVASRLLVVAAIFQVVEAAVAIGLGALAGLGHTRFLLYATLATAWLVKLPFTVALTQLGIGIDAAWWAAGLELVVLGGLVARRLSGQRAAFMPATAAARALPA